MVGVTGDDVGVNGGEAVGAVGRLRPAEQELSTRVKTATVSSESSTGRQRLDHVRGASTGDRVRRGWRPEAAGVARLRASSGVAGPAGCQEGGPRPGSDGTFAAPTALGSCRLLASASYYGAKDADGDVQNRQQTESERHNAEGDHHWVVHLDEPKAHHKQN